MPEITEAHHLKAAVPMDISKLPTLFFKDEVTESWKEGAEGQIATNGQTLSLIHVFLSQSTVLPYWLI